ncbi:MAG: 16S rRNA (uracil(1498)-N(3))-methyltransferase [Pseudomonadota bacterium]
MAARRLYVASPLSTGSEITLGESEARYLGRALRMRNGDDVAVFNGDDSEFSATVQSLAKNQAQLLVGAPVDTQTESPLKVHLVQGVSRGERMDLVVQKATELGIKRLSPVLTEYGVVKLDSERAEKRREHWQKIAISACEQSHRVRPPLIDAPVTLKEFFGAGARESDVDLILQPEASTPLVNVAKPDTKICLLIGPEGGFSDNEYDDADAAGFTSVSLGPRVLRTETAAIAALAVVQSLWGDLQ